MSSLFASPVSMGLCGTQWRRDWWRGEQVEDWTLRRLDGSPFEARISPVRQISGATLAAMGHRRCH